MRITSEKLLLRILCQCHKKASQDLINDDGFTILETLIAIIAIGLFFLGSLQAIVLASYLRIQAVDKQDATNWIQTDLELIRYRAFELDRGSPDSTACTNKTYGTRLETDLTGRFPEASEGTVTIEGRVYTVDRTYTPDGNILKVTYSVGYDSSHARYKGTTSASELATLSTEVLPNQSLNCS